MSPTPTPTPTPTVDRNDGPSTPPTPIKPDPSPAPTAPKAGIPVNVQLVNARYDVNQSAIVATAMVVNRISSTGTCALQTSLGGRSLSAQAGSTADATVTYCGPLTVVVPPGGSGNWSISVSFTDGAFQGRATGEVTVP